jgi:hypothetical protein
VGGVRDVDASWFSETLQPRRYIHSVPKQIATSDHDIADVHPNPKPKTTILRSVASYLGKGLLHSHGTLDGINGTRELCQDTVTSRICDSSPVLGYKAVHDPAMSG